MIVLLSACVSAAGTIISTGTGTDVKIEILRYDPAPAEPGQIMDLWVKVTTQGSLGTTLSSLKTLENVKLGLVEDFPFSAASESEKVKSLGSMSPSETRNVLFKVKVDGDANPGLNEIKFKFMSDTIQYDLTSAPLEIEVKSVSATIAIESVISEPEEIFPGKTATLTITLKNNALSRLKDITAKLDLTSTALPFAPIHSTTEKKLRSMKAGETAEIVYDIIALADADAKVYKVPFTLTYYDDAGNLFSKNDTVGLIVSAMPDLEVAVEDFDTFQAGMTGDVVVSVSNTGPSDIKFMTLKLVESEGYTLLGKGQEYLGNLESDDFETAEFKINIDGDVKDSVALKIVLDYRDAYNNAQEETVMLELPVYSTSEIRAYGLDGDVSSAFMPLVYLLLILYIYFAVKDWRKTRAFDSALKAGVEGVFLTIFRVLFFFRWRNLRRVPRRIKLFFQKL